MPRFFFDVFDGQDLFDEEGVVCVDLAAAQREALRTAGIMLSEQLELRPGIPWSMEIRSIR